MISEGQEKREEMTREKLAENLIIFADNTDLLYPPLHVIRAAAAELRKTCATCQQFAVLPPAGVAGVCKAHMTLIPVDGSGFCHRHEPPPASPQDGAP